MNTSTYFPGQGLFSIFETVSNVSEVVQNTERESTPEVVYAEHISEVDGSDKKKHLMKVGGILRLLKMF